MKKTYEKPMADVVSFQLKEDLTVEGSSMGTTTDPGGGWNHSTDKGEYQYPPIIS